MTINDIRQGANKAGSRTATIHSKADINVSMDQAAEEGEWVELVPLSA